MIEITLTCECGKVRSIYHDELQTIMNGAGVKITRASHVEPAESGGWEADMQPSGGPILGPFPTRKEALQAEVNWLRLNKNL